MTKINAFTGFTINIRNAPMAHPIKAPKIGIRAVNAITIPISRAYGIFKTDIETTNMDPRITASTHCPVKKLEKVL